MNQEVSSPSPKLILGVCGSPQSGKSTIGEYLSLHHGFLHRDVTGNGGPSAASGSDEALMRTESLSSLVEAALETGQSVVVTGLRHREEAAWLQERGGQVIRVLQPHLKGESITIDADHFLLNDGSVQDLWDHASRLLAVLQDA